MVSIIEAILNRKNISSEELKSPILKDMFYGQEPNINLDSISFYGDKMVLDCDKLDIGTYDNCYNIYPTNLNGIIDNFGVKEIDIYNRNPKYSVRWSFLSSRLGSVGDYVDFSKIRINYSGKSPLLLSGVEKIGRYDGNICFHYLKYNQYIDFKKDNPIKPNILLDLKEYKFPILSTISNDLTSSTPIKTITNIMEEVKGIPDGFMFRSLVNIKNGRYVAYFIKGIQNPKGIDDYYTASFTDGIYRFPKLSGSDFKKLPNYKDVYYWLREL